MDVEFFLKMIFIPFVLAISPLIVVIVNLYRSKFTAGFGQIKFKVFLSVSLVLLIFSYLNVWSMLYGSMSKEDWGLGFVKAIGIAGFQIVPLFITIPLAIWVIKSAKT